MAVFNCSTFATIVLASFGMDKVSALSMDLAAGGAVGLAGAGLAHGWSPLNPVPLGAIVQQVERVAPETPPTGSEYVALVSKDPSPLQINDYVRVTNAVHGGPYRGRMGKIIGEEGNKWKIEEMIIGADGVHSKIPDKKGNLSKTFSYNKNPKILDGRDAKLQRIIFQPVAVQRFSPEKFYVHSSSREMVSAVTPVQSPSRPGLEPRVTLPIKPGKELTVPIKTGKVVAIKSTDESDLKKGDFVRVTSAQGTSDYRGRMGRITGDTVLPGRHGRGRWNIKTIAFDAAGNLMDVPDGDFIKTKGSLDLQKIEFAHCDIN